MCIIMVRAGWSLLQYCITHQEGVCSVSLCWENRFTCTWVFGHTSGLTIFQFVTSFFLHGMLVSFEKESFKKSSKWEGKVYVRCTCVCKSESVFFSLSAIYYVKGNRALGKAIPFVQVSAKCNKYQWYSFIARTVRDWNSLANKVIEQQSVEAFKMAV